MSNLPTDVGSDYTQEESDMMHAVSRGVGWLNKNYPGWVDKIDLNELDMSTGTNCVLGQLGFDVNWHDDDRDFFEENGFILHHSEDYCNRGELYSILTVEWVDKIRNYL